MTENKGRPMSTSPPATPERRGIPIPGSSPPVSESFRASLTSSSPATSSLLATTPSDKEREKLLYPGRVNLTSSPSSSCSPRSTLMYDVPQPTPTSMASSRTRWSGVHPTRRRAAPSSAPACLAPSRSEMHLAHTRDPIPSIARYPSRWALCLQRTSPTTP